VTEGQFTVIFIYTLCAISPGFFDNTVSGLLVLQYNYLPSGIKKKMFAISVEPGQATHS
jgi:hypothetical protein